MKRLLETDNPIKQFELTGGIFEALGNSHPSTGKGDLWVKDIIGCYRNLGRIFNRVQESVDIYSEYKKKIEELLKEHQKILGDYDDEIPLNRVNSALDELSGIGDILEKYDVVKEELEDNLRLAEKYEELDKLGFLEKRLEKLDML